MFAALPSGAEPGREPVRRPWLDPVSRLPFLPRGWFLWENGCIGAPTGQPALEKAKADLDAMAKRHVNTVLFVNTWAGQVEAEKLKQGLSLMQQLLEHADSLGIKMLVHLPGAYPACRGTNPDEPAAEAYRTFVEGIKDSPALLGYQLADEPEFRYRDDQPAELAQCVTELEATRTAIRRWDANTNHLCQFVFNLVPTIPGRSDWRAYLPACGAFQIDRYPVCRQFEFFEKHPWGPLRCAWQIAHGVRAVESTPHRNPAVVLQGMGKNYNEGGYHWREPTYEEMRYMAWSSLTAGAWGVFHWIYNVSTPPIRENAARLYAELEQLEPAFKQRWADPPFTVEHGHGNVVTMKRIYLTDAVADITTLALADEANYYLIVSDNHAVIEDLELKLHLPGMQHLDDRPIDVLNESWSRPGRYDAESETLTIEKHTMCFGDINIWAMPR